eukprot:Lankesteria_metandrocarpae@DN1143_c0_g1_i1.p1
MAILVRWFLCIVAVVSVLVIAVDKTKFKVCEESAPCRRYRKYVSRIFEIQHNCNVNSADCLKFGFELTNVTAADSIATDASLKLELKNVADESFLVAYLYAYSFGAIRLRIDEESSNTDFFTPKGRERHAHGGGFRPSMLNPDSRETIEPLMETTLAQLQKPKLELTEFQEGYRTSFESKSLSESLWARRKENGKGSGRNTVEADSVPSTKIDIFLQKSPFSLTVNVDGVKIQELNSRQLMNFERFRMKPEKPEAVSENQVDPSNNENGNSADAAEAEPTQTPDTHFPPLIDATAVDADEHWERRQDTNKQGPAGVGLDVLFADCNVVMGLPEHATNLTLPAYSEPYRMFNADVFEYILDDPMALYGSVPILWSLHDTALSVPVDTPRPVVQTSAFLWLNPSETFVQLAKSPAVQGPAGGVHRGGQVQSWWMSETGIIDLVVLTGPTAQDTLSQYYALTGLPFMSPLFALGRHQSRWNYFDEREVEGINEGYLSRDIPLDVIWLDIEHTDAKKYFTWNNAKFKDPHQMIAKITENHRKLVCIVDPHIKSDSSYRVYEELKRHGLLLKAPNAGTDFEGWCWPGRSAYPDYLHEPTREYWRQQFAPDKWVGTSLDVHLWNDMNEPSVFDGPEVSVPRDVLHLSGIEHRAVHNQYGLAYHSASYAGLKDRSSNDRPFILSRSFYTGTHRTAAIWTGDNLADPTHLAASVPMCLSHGLGGIQFIGADIGGFFGNPSDELIVRWEQFGIWYPFCRAHAHLDTRMREPWTLKSPEDTQRVRKAIIERYKLLPLWYTLSVENSIFGRSIIQPVWWLAPSERISHSVEDMMIIGEVIAVKVPTKSSTGHTLLYSENEVLDVVYLPPFAGESSLWYDYYDPNHILNAGFVEVPVSRDYVPTFIRGGSIIPLKNRIRRSSKLLTRDPFTIHIFLDKEEKATGRLYVDDYDGYNYLKGHFLYEEWSFTHVSNTAYALSSHPLAIPQPLFGVALASADVEWINSRPDWKTDVNCKIETVAVWGLKRCPDTVYVSKGDEMIPLTFTSSESNGRWSISVKMISAYVGSSHSSPWTLTVRFGIET